MKSKVKASPPKGKKSETPETPQEEKIQQPLMEKSFISSDIVVTGDVMSEGELNIDGVINGNIRSFIIVIGENGCIDGDLVGDSITVKGKVTGNIRGVEVNLLEGCEVQGNIVHEKLNIRNGAMFEGEIRRVNSKLAPASNPKMANASEMPMTPKQAGKSNIEPIVHATGLVPKTPANRPHNPGNDKNPIIVKDVAMIMSSDNGSKK